MNFLVKKKQFSPSNLSRPPPTITPLPAPSTPASRPLYPRFRTLYPRFRTLYPRTPAPPVHPLNKRFLSRGMLPLSGHDDVALLNDVANDTESTQKLKITSLSLVWRVKQGINW